MSALGRRHLVPELLDALPEGDPRAVRSRRDLARVNRLMANAAIMARLLQLGLHRAPRRILEIGAGDGRLMLALARRMAGRWPGVELLLLDRQALVTPERIAEFASLGWHARPIVDEVFSFAERNATERFDAIVANLVLHHFDEVALFRLLSLLAPMAPVMAATEPRRAVLPHIAAKLLFAIGANHITRHDAPASVRAGFVGRELTALWPGGGKDVRLEGRRGLFTHAFLVSAAGGER